MLQQPIRRRQRRQDVYDLARLIETFDLDRAEQAAILEDLLIKCRARDIEPDSTSISAEEVVSRARANWQTIQVEIDEPLLPFEDRFAIVRAFYEGLPWG